MGSTFDDLKELKAMLDRGEITQSEYDIVKAELLAEAAARPHDPGVQSAKPPDQTAPEPNATLTQPSQPPVQPWYQKRWVWLVAAIVVLAGLANLGGGISAFDSGQDGNQRSSNVASSSNSATSCSNFMDAMADLSGDTTDAINASTAAATDSANGVISMTAAASIVDTAADDIERVSRQLDALGTPPPSASESVRLFEQALDRYHRSFIRAAGGMRQRDLSAINEAALIMAEGTELIEDATDALQACP